MMLRLGVFLMPRTFISSRWAAAFVVLLVVAHTAIAAEDATRTFPEFKCRYTLPDSHWSWTEHPSNVILFLARSDNGLAVNLSCQRHPNPGPIDASFGPGYESTFFVPGKAEKRGSRLLTF